VQNVIVARGLDLQKPDPGFLRLRRERAIASAKPGKI
jgi:hypothetical protein